MKVLLIPEDFRKDGFILQPLFDRLCAASGKPTTKVIVCRNPFLQGVTEALKEERLREIVERYPMIDVFILCVDRHGIPTRQHRLRQLEKIFAAPSRVFLAVNAWEELETWVLAGLDLPRGWSWANIRQEVSVKERYFELLAQQRGVADGPGGGRKALGEEASRRIQVIRQKCPEDFDDIANRLAAVI